MFKYKYNKSISFTLWIPFKTIWHSKRLKTRARRRSHCPIFIICAEILAIYVKQNTEKKILYSTTVIAKIKGMPRSLFYDIPCHVTMDYEKWCTSLLLTQMWRNPCIWSSKSCQLHVDFTSQLWCWPCIFRISI